jgi:hypothetical protein
VLEDSQLSQLQQLNVDPTSVTLMHGQPIFQHSL